MNNNYNKGFLYFICAVSAMGGTALRVRLGGWRSCLSVDAHMALSFCAKVNKKLKVKNEKREIIGIGAVFPDKR